MNNKPILTNLNYRDLTATNRQVYFGPAEGFKFLFIAKNNEIRQFIFYDTNEDNLKWLEFMINQWDGYDFKFFMRETAGPILLKFYTIEELDSIVDEIIRELGGESEIEYLWYKFNNSHHSFISADITNNKQLIDLLNRAEYSKVYFNYDARFENQTRRLNTFKMTVFDHYPAAILFGLDSDEYRHDEPVSTTDNNILTVSDSQGNFTHVSVEHLHALEHNRFRGWWCSAGLRSLYIDFDGNVFRGTCHEGGWIGNVNNPLGLHEIDALRRGRWIKCNTEICSCGADIKTPKVQAEDPTQFFTDLYDINNNRRVFKLVQIAPIESIEKQVVYGKDYNDFKQIIWDIGRRCNFDCWYCSPNSHNNFDIHRTLDNFVTNYNILKEYWIRGEQTKFAFSGGEPTVYKDFLDFVKLVRSDRHLISVTSNGSNTSNYYRELIKHSSIVFSLHLDYINKFGIDRFIKSISGAVESRQQGHEQDLEYKWNWIGARIMLTPGNLEFAQTVHREFSQAFPDISITVGGVHTTDQVLHRYNEEELSWIKQIEN